MRILAVTNMYPIDPHPTSGIYVEQQVRGLREIGLDVDVLLFNRKVHGVRVYFRMAQNVHERLKSQDYDVVHVMYGGIMADIVTRAVRDIPTVFTIHGSDLFGESLATPSRRLLANIGVRASGRAARRATGVVVVSPGLKDALPADVDRSKVRVIPCGIDMDRFQPKDPAACRQQLLWKNGSFHVLFATSGDRVKRPELARKAIAKLQQSGVPVELHEMRNIPYEQVPTWINASDALILTSLHEGSPTIVKECLACNVPIVSVDVGDVRQRMGGVSGCFVVSDDEDALASALKNVYSLRPRINGRSSVEELSLRHIAERLASFYGELTSIESRSLSDGRSIDPVRN